MAVVPTPFGRAVHVSGQVAWDAGQNIVGPGDIGRQLEQSLDNLAAEQFLIEVEPSVVFLD